MLLFKSNIYVWGILRVLPKFLQAFILAKVLDERHRYLKQFMDSTAQDFQDDRELTEFEVLDTADWDLNDD